MSLQWTTVRSASYTTKRGNMSSKTKTMEEIVSGLKVSQNPGSLGKPLKIEECDRERALGLMVDRLY